MFFPARQDFYSSHGSGELISKGAFTRSQSLSYAMSLPVATTISGMDSMEVLDQNLAILRGGLRGPIRPVLRGTRTYRSCENGNSVTLPLILGDTLVGVAGA